MIDGGWEVYDKTLMYPKLPDHRIYLQVLARSEKEAGVTAKITGRFAKPLRVVFVQGELED